MSDFDAKARDWDKNPVILERSEAIAGQIKRLLPLNNRMQAMEYGAGTAALSFLLKDVFAEIVLMDNSAEMVKVMNEKIQNFEIKNLKPLFFDLEHSDFADKKFDIIYSQMVMHHVMDLNALFKRFFNLLNDNGYLVIADLYNEDGTFHDATFTGHKGFDVEELLSNLKSHGFKFYAHNHCFTINRIAADGTNKSFPIFIVVVRI